MSKEQSETRWPPTLHKLHGGIAVCDNGNA
jgi:hypothetical protein